MEIKTFNAYRNGNVCNKNKKTLRICSWSVNESHKLEHTVIEWTSLSKCALVWNLTRAYLKKVDLCFWTTQFAECWLLTAFVFVFVGASIINIHFLTSRDHMLRMTRDAYVELASEAHQRLALTLHQKLYKGSCIKGWLLHFALF